MSLGSLTALIVVHPRFQGRRWRGFRVACFVGLGMSGIAPVVHGLYLFGLRTMLRQSGLPYYLAEAGLLVTGAVVYAVSKVTGVLYNEFAGTVYQIVRFSC